MKRSVLLLAAAMLFHLAMVPPAMAVDVGPALAVDEEPAGQASIDTSLPERIPLPHDQAFTTNESPFTPGEANQGWWSDTKPASDVNENYFVGITPTGNTDRNFFTFDLASLSGTVARAQLVLARYDGSGDPREILTLYHVETDAATLNMNEGLNADIYADLGSGTAYGTYSVATESSHPNVVLDLNAQGIAAINAARGGFFSIGGSLRSAAGPGEGLFGLSGSDGVQALLVHLA